jgi:hypothetical protein
MLSKRNRDVQLLHYEIEENLARHANANSIPKPRRPHLADVKVVGPHPQIDD